MRTIVLLDNYINGEFYKDFLDRYYVPMLEQAAILQQDNALYYTSEDVKCFFLEDWYCNHS